MFFFVFCCTTIYRLDGFKSTRLGVNFSDFFALLGEVFFALVKSDHLAKYRGLKQEVFETSN